MDYLGYFNGSSSTVATHDEDESETVNRPDESHTENTTSHFDLLSFFATALQRTASEKDEWNTLVFFSIHLGPWNMHLPWEVYSGTTFSVTLLSRKFLSRQTPVQLDDVHLMPNLVAVKTPKLKPGNSTYNSRLLRSLAKEYQILKNDQLAKHENIVTAHGCIWQTLTTGQSQPTPSLILDGAKLGDLSNFSHSRFLTLRERIWLCLDITEGLHMIHNHGVIHGDLKPNNVLIFKTPSRGYTAKLADFGSAIILSETELPCQAPTGSKIYRAPECVEGSDSLGRDGLVKTDLFSLGVTFAFLLVGDHIIDRMMDLSDSCLQSLKEENKFVAWIIAHRDEPATVSGVWQNDHDWVTDVDWIGTSVFADSFLSSQYLALCNMLLAADVRWRVQSVDSPKLLLKYMLRRHLQTLPSKTDMSSSNAHGYLGPASLASLASLMRMSKAKMRKLTGEKILPETKINKHEIEILAQCCDQPESYVKEAKFIIERNYGRKFIFKPHSRKWHTQRAFSRRQDLGTWRMQSLMKYANKMLFLERHLINKESQQRFDLEIVSLQKTTFRPSRNGNIFWMFPQPVLEILKSQLFQQATDSRNTVTDRDIAANEYAAVVFNSNHLDEAEIDNALTLLTHAARNGDLEAQISVGTLCQVFERPLAASRAEEIGCLLQASKAGSTTAKRRFRKLDANGFVASMRDAKTSGGATCPCLNCWLLETNHEMWQTTGLVGSNWPFLHFLVTIGDVNRLLRNTSNMSSSWFESQNSIGETPLIIACREGHMVMAELLLARGANASHETAFGVTALHFLAAFDDDEIPIIASKLIQHGADVDKVCGQDRNYSEIFDSPFGRTGGTPLLWAVSAGNQCAVRELVAQGANPLAREQRSGNSEKWDLIDSPLTHSLLFHQSALLKIIVGAMEDDSDVRQRSVIDYTMDRQHSYRALCRAIDSPPGARVHEYLLHGLDYQHEAFTCVKLLLESGVDPTWYLEWPSYDIGARKNSPVMAACISGNIAILNYLWEYDHGLLRPTPDMWAEAINQSVFSGHQESFEFLIDHRSDIADDVDSDLMAVFNTLNKTKTSYFTSGILRILQRPGVEISSEDKLFVLSYAIMGEHFEVAEQVIETLKPSLTKRLEGRTLLHEFIIMSYDHLNMESKVSFFLSLPVNKDILFWNVAYVDCAGATALHCAAKMPTKKTPASPGVFEILLENFSEPKYLNAQLKGGPEAEKAGYTALHFAVEWSYSDAVASLVEMPGIETSLLSQKGETPLDICVKIALDFEKLNQRSFPDDKMRKIRITTNIAILDRLLHAENEARITKYSTLFLRKTEDECTLVDAVRGALYGVKMRDLLESGQGMSCCSRSLVDDTAIGSILAFPNDASDFPADLKACIESYWSLKGGST